MPRRSHAALTQFPRIDVGQPTHLKTPDDLPNSLRAIVDELIQSQSPGHFRPGDEILLEAYAAAHLLRREAFEKVEAEGAVTENGKSSPWLVVMEKTGKALVSLSGRLRLAPQMRASSRDTSRGGAPSNYQAPWRKEDT
jgi:phage terminase small subunit